MYKNNRGAALLHVLMLSALLAGLAVMVLRATLSRQVTARQTRHAVGVHQAVTACIAEINNMWGLMTPEQYETSLSSCSCSMGFLLLSGKNGSPPGGGLPWIHAGSGSQ